MTQPDLILTPFANSASPAERNDIPDERFPGMPPQSAAWDSGFPAITMQDFQLGGLPPNGQDFNGILYELSQHIVHQNLGGMYKFSADVVAAGGYPQGALIAANDGLSFWASLQDDNVQDFNGPNKDQWSLVAEAGLDSALAAKADKTTLINAGTGLSGGGSLASDRTLSVDYGTTASTAAQGNDERFAGIVPVRQTVLSGPKNSAGRADFMEAIGLNVRLKASVINNPLVVTIGDGFGDLGLPKNITAPISVQMDLGAAEDNSTSYVYIGLLGSTITGIILPNAPVYGMFPPAGSGVGRVWYPINHTHCAKWYQGGEWVDFKMVCVGEIVASSGSVNNIRNYAYQGVSFVTDGVNHNTNSYQVNLVDFLGVPPAFKDVVCTVRLSKAFGDAAIDNEIIFPVNTNNNSGGDNSAQRRACVRVERNSVSVYVAGSEENVDDRIYGYYSAVARRNF